MNYSIFGKVNYGQDVVDKIGNLPVKMSSSGERSAPTVDILINTIEISEQ